MAYRKKLKHIKSLDREARRKKDGSTLAQDIHYYRHFLCFIKIALELERKRTKFTIFNESHSVKFNRKHRWYKLIDLKSFPRNIKFLEKKISGITTKVKKLVDTNPGLFWKFRKHFLLPQVKKVDSSKTKDFDPSKYDVFVVPKNKTINENLNEIRTYLRTETTSIRKGQKLKKDKGADIQFSYGRDSYLQKLFYILLIRYTNPKFTNFEVYNHLQNRLYKRPLIKIEKRVSVEQVKKSEDLYGVRDYDKEGRWGKKKQVKNLRQTATTTEQYEIEIRNTMRDIKYAKIIILNLCKGEFPRYDKIIKN